MLPQCKSELLFSVISKNLISIRLRTPLVPYLFDTHALPSAISPPTSMYIILNRWSLLEKLPRVLSMDPGDYMALTSSSRSRLASVSLAPKIYRWDTGWFDDYMHEGGQPSLRPLILPCACLRRWFHSNQASSHLLAFECSNLWLFCSLRFSILYLYPTTPPPSEIMPGQMSLLLLGLLLLPGSDFPSPLHRLSNRPCSSLTWTWLLRYQWLSVCVFQLSS